MTYQNDLTIHGRLQGGRNGANKRSSILRNASFLRKSEHHKNTYISQDMSFKEREAAKVLRMELKKRRSQGEQNIVIRHGKIVTVKQTASTTASNN